MLLRREVLALLVEALHYVEGFEVLFDGPEEVGAALAYCDAVAVPEDVVDHCHHAVFAREIGRAVELCEEEENRVVLLVGCCVPSPGAEGGQRVEGRADFERCERCGEENIAQSVFRFGAGLGEMSAGGGGTAAWSRSVT